MVTGTGRLDHKRAGHHRGHTDETLWRAWPGWANLLDLHLPSAGVRVVVVSAHPDDDVLALGGLVQRLHAGGCELAFVCCTDGEASHPGSPTMTREQLALARADELNRAQARLGHAASQQEWLHLPDGHLVDASARLPAMLARHVEWADVVVAPWRDDGHPDHEACGRAVAEVTFADPGAGPRVWEYPVWAWHWATPGTAAIPWRRTRAVRLSARERVGKAEAIACFDSQVRPLSDDPADAVVLPDAVLAHFTRTFEVVFT